MTVLFQSYPPPQQQIAGCIAIFHKHYCDIKHGGIIKICHYEILGVYYWYYWYVKIPQCGYTDHRLEYITFYVQNHIAPLTVCSNLPLDRDRPLGAPAFVKLAYCHSINEFENVACKTVVIILCPQCVNISAQSCTHKTVSAAYYVTPQSNFLT